MQNCSPSIRPFRLKASDARRNRGSRIAALVLAAGAVLLVGCGEGGNRSEQRTQVAVGTLGIDDSSRTAVVLDSTGAADKPPAQAAAEVSDPIPSAAVQVSVGIIEDAKFTASDGAASDFFGHSVSLSGDVALVGAPNDDDIDAESGSAYVYRFDGVDWIEEAKLTASDSAANDRFGGAVSLSGDLALIGAASDDDDGAEPGAAYVFRFDGSSWVEETKLTASDGAAGDEFGASVSLSGEVALVGAHFDSDNDNGSYSGSAYVFRFDGSSWVEESKLAASDGAAFDEFGNSVSLSGDVALIGAYGDHGITGAAYVFRLDDGADWVEEAKLTASDGGTGDFFGISVSLSGSVAIVGAFGDDNFGSDSGAAYMFRFDGTDWVQEVKLTAPDGAAADWFGYSVSLDGQNALVGARYDDDHGSFSGSAYVFRFDMANWIDLGKFTASDGEGFDDFGSSVSISSELILIGAASDDDNGAESGSAYIFIPEPGTALGLVTGSILLAVLKRRRG